MLFVQRTYASNKEAHIYMVIISARYHHVHYIGDDLLRYQHIGKYMDLLVRKVV